MSGNDIHFDSALSMASRIRSGEVGAVEMLNHCLDRVDRINPRLNAIVFEQRDAALRRARQADAALARGERWGPLHGVPMTIKESIDWVGAPTTRGNERLRHNRPEVDATVVRLLTEAGAVIFGKTNVPTDLQDWQTFNPIYGTTNNPWNLKKVPGGSSGGSAAALAAGLTALEFASDIGASIRNPAHYCGVFGHKPTYGVVPWEGTQAPGTFFSSDLVVAGPMARSAGDLRVAMEVVTREARCSASGWRLNLPAAQKQELSQYRVAVMLEHPSCRQDAELTAVLLRAVEALKARGVSVDMSARPDLDLVRAHHIYLMCMRAATGARLDDQAYGRFCEGAGQLDPEDWSYRAYVLRAAGVSHREWWLLQNERRRMLLQWNRFFERYDLLLAPCAASAAFDHDHRGERADRKIPVSGALEPVTDQLAWAGLANFPNLPATALPAGLTAGGLPCGLQAIGPPFHDMACIRFAELASEALGGFRPPPI